MTTALALFFLSSFAAQDPSADDEEKLFTRSIARALETIPNPEGERACREFMEKFPKSKRLEEVLRTLAHLTHYRAGGCEEARRLYARLLEQFPKSESTWTFRLDAAETWRTQGLWGRAVDAYREIANETKDRMVRSSAVQGIWRITGQQLSLYQRQTFTTGQTPELQVSVQKLKGVTFRCSRIKYEALIPHLEQLSGSDFQGVVDKVGPESRTLVKEWVEPLKEYETYKAIPLPATESGLYVVEAE